MVSFCKSNKHFIFKLIFGSHCSKQKTGPACKTFSVAIIVSMLSFLPKLSWICMADHRFTGRASAKALEATKKVLYNTVKDFLRDVSLFLMLLVL